MKNSSVIASAAKQSRVLLKRFWIASSFSLLAMTLVEFSYPAFACDEAEHAINELEQTIAANGAPHSEPAATLQAAPFPAQIASEEGLKQLAETSTWGGGRYEITEFAGHKLALAYRSYTSGVKSADIGIYVEKDGGWHLVKSHPPVYNAWITSAQQDGSFVFRRDDNNDLVMTLTAAEIAG